MNRIIARALRMIGILPYRTLANVSPDAQTAMDNADTAVTSEINEATALRDRVTALRGAIGNIKNQRNTLLDDKAALITYLEGLQTALAADDQANADAAAEQAGDADDSGN